MKMIIAIIPPEKLDDVKEALFHNDIHKMPVSRVRSCGQQMGFTEHYRIFVMPMDECIRIRTDETGHDAIG